MLPGLVLVAAATATTVAAGGESSGGGGADGERIHRWTFTSAADGDGWTVGNHLTDLGVADGKLRMTITGYDAFLYGPPVSVPLDGCTLRIRFRADRDGPTQIYWTTNDYPQFGERQVTSRFTAGGEVFGTVAYTLGSPADSGRTLTRFRIDPCNGNEAGTVEIESVELLRLRPKLDVNFAPAEHWIDAGRASTARLMVRQIAGRAAEQAYQVEWLGGHRQPVTLSPGRTQTVEREFPGDRAGVRQLRAVVREGTKPPRFDLTASVIVGRGERLPIAGSIRTDRVRLDFIRSGAGGKVGGARWQIRTGADRWRTVGWLLPLARLALEGEDGVILRHEPALTLAESSPSGARLTAMLEGDAPWRIDVDLRIDDGTEPHAIEVTARLAPPEGGRLVEFAGPIVRLDAPTGHEPLDRYGMFGGLEYLEPGWPSSSDRAVGEQFADRWLPLPHKITLPVMAVEAAGVTTSLMWQPTQAWDGTETMPAATFASPNFVDGQDNHLFKLAAPGVGPYVTENTSYVHHPYVTHRDKPLTLAYVLAAETDLPVTFTARRWYERFGASPPPPAPHDDKTTYDQIARNYGETMYWPEEKGWRHHWFHTETTSRPIPFMAGELVAHARHTGRKEWIDRLGLGDRTIIDTIGPLAVRLGHDGHARGMIASMRPDATWPYRDTEEVKQRTREFTHGKYDTLGEDGSTSLGTCVQHALPILHWALFTGESEFVAASLEALEAMKRFRIPRGAQVWEVHKDIPDIRAAALAVEANHIGYQLTNDPGWLDEASYWAWSGVPFVHSWHVPIEHEPGVVLISRDKNNRAFASLPLADGYDPPNRQVTPYGTVPVLGPTFYVVNWYGVLVQWCGLEWAWKVIELDRDRPDPQLRYIADGVVLSGRQQMLDRPPWVGLYPDSWNLEANRAQPAYISGRLIAMCMQAQQRMPALAWP